MMTEYGYVEKPILEWLAGKPTDADDRGLGWRFRTEEEMAEFNRPLEDPLVERLLLPALLRINRSVKTEAQARLAVDALRRVMANPDPLEANRRTLEALRDGVPVVLSPGEPAVTVRFFAFDADHQHLNDFTVTNQYRVRGTETIKADTVLLVNGIPLALAEYKSYVNSGHDWKEGVNQLHRYQREAPALLTANVFAVAADEQEFRYGPVAFQIGTQRDIDLQRDHWRPWLSQYPRRRAYWNLPDDQLDPDPHHPFRREAPVFVHDERRLEVVVKRDDARAVDAKVGGGRLPLQVDEDPLDDLAVLDDADRVERLFDDVFVDPAPLEDLGDDLLVDPAGEEVGVERVDVSVGLGVVAEERLVPDRAVAAIAIAAHRCPGAQQRRELVAELVAHRPEPQPQQVPQVRLEGEGVPRDAVEAELVLEVFPHLLGRAREDVHADAGAHHFA